MTIKYADHEGFGKVPDSWTGYDTYTSSGTIQCRVSGEVTKLEINPDLPPSEFDYKFLPGAVITDERNREVYVARADSSLRLVTREERRKGIPYEVLMTTDPPAECGD